MWGSHLAAFLWLALFQGAKQEEEVLSLIWERQMDLSKCGAEGRQIDPFPQCGKYYTEGSLRKKGFMPASDGGAGKQGGLRGDNT